MDNYRYTIMVNKDEYVKGVFDTEKDAYAYLQTELTYYCSKETIKGAVGKRGLDALADGYGLRVVEIVPTESTESNPLKLVTITVATNYRTTIESRFLATDLDIENHKVLIGQTIYFGEYEGKHSEVEGSFTEEDMTIEELSTEASQAILDNVGKHIAGENLFDHFEISEQYYEVFEIIEEHLTTLMSEDVMDKLEKEIIDKREYVTKVEGRYKPYYYTQALESVLSLKTLEEWAEKLADECDDNPEDLTEDIKAEMKQWIEESVSAL